MAPQSTLDRLKTARVSRGGLFGLGAGIVVGLLLGLLIGWVWWPVEWQGNQAPFSTGAVALSPELEASYMGAIADAYASSAGNADAAALAAQRLAGLGGDVRTRFESAIRYYGAQPNGQTQITNLTMLAAAVGVPLAAVNNAATAGGDSVSAPTEAQPQQTTADGARGNSGGGLAGWLLVFLTALLLVGGGLYILYRLAQQRKVIEDEETTTAFAEEDALPSGSPSTVGFNRESLRPASGQPSAATVAAASAATATRAAKSAPRPMQPTGEYGFDEDQDDEENSPAVSFHPPAPGLDDTDEMYEGLDQDEEPDQDAAIDEEIDDGTPLAMPPAARYATAVGATPPYTGAGTEPRQPASPTPNQDSNIVVPASTNASGAPIAPASSGMPETPTTRLPSTTPAAPQKLATPSRYDRYTTLESHTAAYSVGMTDFDYTKNIENPNGNGYIGEYGIGISDRHGTLSNSLEQVVALEVYLFDKSDEALLTTVTRALLSEYAYDNLYSFFDREKQSADPITAQLGVNFQLEGRQLLLDCTVKDVRYTSDGVFKSISVDMVLKQRV